MKVSIQGKEIDVKQPTRILDLIDDKEKNYVCCYVDNKLKDLTYVVTSDCKVELLDINSYDGVNTYQATIRYIVAMAVKNIY